MFLSDASFSVGVPNVSNWSKRIANIGENNVGKIFLKNAQDITRKLPNGKVKTSFGIANSGKTLRKTPFAITGGLGVAYGGYRAKKTYDKYKPEIQTGRKLMRTYNQFKNLFNKE
jgi:hypothetical protein